MAITVTEMFKQDAYAAAMHDAYKQQAELNAAKAAAIMKNYLDPPAEPTPDQQVLAHRPKGLPDLALSTLKAAANNGHDLELVNKAAQRPLPARNDSARVLDKAKSTKGALTFKQCDQQGCKETVDGGGRVTFTRAERVQPRYDEYGARIWDDDNQPVNQNIGQRVTEDDRTKDYCLVHYMQAIRGK
jgi:hypothetical protein